MQLSQPSTQVGTLWVVATPIGHLADISYRAVAVLKQVDVIAAEDTRHTRNLLRHYQIENRLISLHGHNERKRTALLLDRLACGEQVALVADAGTPAISDPGFFLIRAVREQGYTVHPVPGASAFVAALSASGVATDRFIFDGFLPVKSSPRCRQYAEYRYQPRTVVVYESSHRILASLEDLIAVLGGQRHIVVARELTKVFETFFIGPAEEVWQQIQADADQSKGEFVVLISGAELPLIEESDIAKVLQPLLLELPTKQAVALTVQITGCKRTQAYQLALRLNGN